MSGKFHYEDKLLEGSEIEGINKINCLKNTAFEKLNGESTRQEIIWEFIASRTKKETTKKYQFSYKNLKLLLKMMMIMNTETTTKRGIILFKGNQIMMMMKNLIIYK